MHISDTLTAAVAKYFANALEASVVVGRSGHLYSCDISVHVGRGVNAVASASAGEVYPACDAAVDTVAKRLRRHKRRLNDHHRNPAPESMAAPYAVLDFVADDAETMSAPDAPLIVAELTADILTLSVGEAAMRLDLGQQPFLLFKNAAHGGLNLVYRRTDGNYGWIDPSATQPRDGMAALGRSAGA